MALKFLISVSLLIILCGCSVTPPPPIMTDEKFSTRVTDQGIIQFVYGISWRHTSEASLLINQPDSVKNSNRRARSSERSQRNGEHRGFAEFPQNRLSLQANNLTKLELEDKAALALNKRLSKEKTCDNGYDIEQVIWKADNIRLVGFCL